VKLQMELEQKQREEEDALYRKFLQVRLVTPTEGVVPQSNELTRGSPELVQHFLL
jgi:hypothetical protein